MIDLINSVFSRAFGGGSCGSTTGSNGPTTHHKSSIRVKSPKPLSPRRTVVRFVESRDDDRKFIKSTSFIDMASASNESGERDSVGTREMLMQDDNPLSIMERKHIIQNNVSEKNIDNSNEGIPEGSSFESHLSNIQHRLEKIDNARKRGLEQIGKFLPSISIAFEQQDNNNIHNNRQKSLSSEHSNQLETLERMRCMEYCPQCRAYLRYFYISSPGNLFDTIEGRDPPNKKLQNIMPPYCDKCQAHLLFDNTPTKQQMIENLERWLEMNLDLQTNGKIIFINASSNATTSPCVTIEYTPKGSKQGLVSFSFQDVDVNPLHTASSLTEAVGVGHYEVPERNDSFEHHTNLFISDSNTATVTDDATGHDQNEIQIVSTESEEQAILRQYSVVKDIATDSITKHLKMHYELTSDLCGRCQMPMMKMGDSIVYCIVCPVIDESAKRSAKEKRNRIQQLYGRNLSTCQYATNVNSDHSAQQILTGNARLTALEEGLGFIYSPKNQDNDLAVSSCMSNDDDEEPSTTKECGSINGPPVHNSQSSDHSSFPSVQQDPSYQDHINNQYSIGIEYTYSQHMQNLSRGYAGGDCSGSASMPSESNIISQSSTVSETQCPRNLPSSQMIWSQINNNNSSVQISFEATSNEFFVDKKKEDGLSAAVSDERRVCKYDDKAVSLLEQAEADETRIARFSMSGETRDDGESNLRNNRQQSVEGALQTPRTFNLTECIRQGPDTADNHKPCESESTKTVRVFGQTMIRSPRSESLPPLFPPPNAPPVVDTLEQYPDAEPTFESKEELMPQVPISTIKEKGSALFPPPRNSSYVVDEEKAHLATRNDVGSDAKTHVLTLEGSSSYQRVGFTRREQRMNQNETKLSDGPSSARLPLSRSQYLRETMISDRAADPSPVRDSSPNRMDPPGKRLTKSKRSEGGPLDPPDSDLNESEDTPKRSNRHHKAQTQKQHDFGKPKRIQSSSHIPSLTSKPTNRTKSKQHHHGIKSTECESSRGFPFRNVGSSEQKSRKSSANCRKLSKNVDDPAATATAENNVLVTIPSWVDKEIVNSPVKSGTCGDSSVDRLIQQIDDIEADFGSIIASIPSTLETNENVGELKPRTQTTNNKTKDRQVKRQVSSPIAVVEVKQDNQSYGKHACRDTLNIVNSFDSDASDNSVLTSLAEKIRHVRDQIDQIDSSDESDDDESIAAADSQEEMLQLLSRLNNAAESLRTFADFQD